MLVRWLSIGRSVQLTLKEERDRSLAALLRRIKFVTCPIGTAGTRLTDRSPRPTVHRLAQPQTPQPPAWTPTVDHTMSEHIHMRMRRWPTTQRVLASTDCIDDTERAKLGVRMSMFTVCMHIVLHKYLLCLICRLRCSRASFWVVSEHLEPRWVSWCLLVAWILCACCTGRFGSRDAVTVITMPRLRCARDELLQATPICNTNWSTRRLATFGRDCEPTAIPIGRRSFCNGRGGGRGVPRLSPPLSLNSERRSSAQSSARLTSSRSQWQAEIRPPKKTGKTKAKEPFPISVPSALIPQAVMLRQRSAF